jgi:hypothetical protein
MFFFLVMYIQSSNWDSNSYPYCRHVCNPFDDVKAHFLCRWPCPFFSGSTVPPPSRTCPFNKLVLDFLDIEAEQGEDSDRHGSPSCWLRLLRLKTPPHMYCVCLSFYKFICWISMYMLQTPFNSFILCWCLMSIVDVSLNFILNILTTTLQDLW